MNEGKSELEDLLTTFQVSALGQGDSHLGINLLASMACVLADLAPTDGTIVTKDGRPVRLGMNLLVTSAASAALIRDEVLTEIGLRQENARKHFQCYAEWVEEQRQKPGATPPPTGPKTNAAEHCFAETLCELGPLSHTIADAWSMVLREPPAEQLQHVLDRPKFFVGATRPGDLENQLQGLRPGRPLIHLGLGQPSDLVQLTEPCAALVGGRFSLGTGCESVCANLLITDAMQMLGKAAKAPDDRTAWLGHFLWLCDGEAGPEAPSVAQVPEGPETITERFRFALDHMITQRLALQKKKPALLCPDTRKTKLRWTAFLREMEPRLPGVSGAARNLIGSLVFGLHEMARIEEHLRFSIAGVEALARLLVHRMANARTTMLHAAALDQRKSQIERVHWKLSQGPAEPREIYHNLSLSAGDCDQCLRWLQDSGYVRQINRKWELVENTRLSFKNCSLPLLEA